MFLLYVLYKNIYPVADPPFNAFPYVAAAWMAAGFAIVLLSPGLARRVGRRFIEDEGLRPLADDDGSARPETVPAMQQVAPRALRSGPRLLVQQLTARKNGRSLDAPASSYVRTRTFPSLSPRVMRPGATALPSGAPSVAV